VNFVGKLSSVESLKQNLHLRELYLVGNPCADFQGYRQYVVAVLPQLQVLHSRETCLALFNQRISGVQWCSEIRQSLIFNILYIGYLIFYLYIYKSNVNSCPSYT